MLCVGSVSFGLEKKIVTSPLLYRGWINSTVQIVKQKYINAMHVGNLDALTRPLVLLKRYRSFKGDQELHYKGSLYESSQLQKANNIDNSIRIAISFTF